ncbi:MAG: enoyl-CoA hydratase/isomerase family protein [Chloroflexi bacterium]|nr:enoyl-CoA hydratase/isomerase family protein [Chloroflexota bacterium]
MAYERGRQEGPGGAPLTKGVEMDLKAPRAPYEMHGDSWYNKPLDYKVVIYEANHETHVAKVTMNRPERLNALSHQLRSEVFHALKVAEKDKDINVVVLKGAGRAFSTGYDLGGGNAGVDEPDFGSQYIGDSHWHRYLVNQYWQVWELSKIVIAQTHGYVLAGGSDLMSVCDLLVTTPDCQFGYPAIRAMSAPDLMWFPWFLPKMRAAEMVYTGDSITGEEMHRLGAATYCVPQKDIDEFTESFAKRVALIPWQANSIRKRMLNKAYEFMGWKLGLEITALMQEQLGQTEPLKQWGEKFRQMPLREYLTLRDKPYADYRTAEQTILERAKREGDAWKGVSKETRPKS